MPLCLAYARTIHKFQGLSAGPVDKGKIPNMYECIVCDPDKRHVEGSALGLLYTAVSRATTLGDKNGIGSAIYFTGDSFTESRIRNLGKIKNSTEDYKRIKQRNLWIDFLKLHKHESCMTQQQALHIINWARCSRISRKGLFDHIENYVIAKTKTQKTRKRKR